jgi:hypothetical protein
MDNWKLGVFIREIDYQTEVFNSAAADFNAAFKKLSPRNDDAPEQWVRLFSSLQLMLVSAGMISKLLWPSPPSLDQRGQPVEGEARRRFDLTIARGRAVRRALRVRSIPILERRQMRNAIEHFDDRLDEFLDGPQRFWVVDQNVGRPEDVSVVMPPGDKPLKFMRHFNPETRIASIMDDEINVQELADAVAELQDKARRWLATAQDPEP